MNGFRNPRPGAWICLGVLVVSGCSSSLTIPRTELAPGSSFDKSRVRTNDGLEYGFDRVLVHPDSLVGEYSVEVERQDAEHGVYYEDQVRTQAVPLSRVESVVVSKRDPEKTFFLGAGVVATAFLIKNLTDTSIGQNDRPRAAIKQE
jgi:hypothetical protein